MPTVDWESAGSWSPYQTPRRSGAPQPVAPAPGVEEPPQWAVPRAQAPQPTAPAVGDTPSWELPVIGPWGNDASFDQVIPKQRFPPPQAPAPAPAPPAAPPTAATPPAPTGPTAGQFQSWFMNQLAGKPFNQQTLLDLEPLLMQFGSKLTPPNMAGERTKIWDPDSQQWVRVGFGEGHPVWIGQGAGGGVGGSGYAGSPTLGTGSTFTDPATQQLQQFAQQWLGELETQRTRTAGQAETLRGRQQQSQAAVDRLVEFLTKRSTELQGPAFTGPQQEILRTQVLDPIERDRTAQQQRVLERISRAGYLPSSGTAIDLQNQVDQAFNQERAGVQGNLAAQEIAQERANQQEAQQLLSLIPQTLSAGNAGQLEFLQALDAAVNQPRQQQFPLSSLIYDLPNNALQQALATLGMGPSPQSVFGSAAQLRQLQQQQQAQGLQWYEQLGRLLPFLTGGR